MTNLPIHPYAETLRQQLAAHRRLILSAPPGTGKSTQVPQFLLPESSTAVVLQPRRIAARSLAARVAAERGEALGETVGYQVRFERQVSAATRLVFATYGVFWQRIQQDPTLAGISLVILDEFHERTLEADACLAWLKQLQEGARPDLAFVVMSATLEGERLAEYLDQPPYLEVDARAHDVEISYQSPQSHEPLWSQAVRGFRHLLSEGLDGSVLVFMPGVGEIRRTVDALEPLCRDRGFRVLELSGSQSPEAQQRALSLPASEPCVIVATNVAETSLTIPGVVAVIDSGLARHAAYDPHRDLDTLHLGLISRQNATQRAGRAGRLGPGRCLRLWPKTHESAMPEAMAPEIGRLDLSRLALSSAGLPEPLHWLDAPPADRWERTLERLRELEALDASDCLTPLGKRLLRFPLPPSLARVLMAAKETGCATLAAAMVAVLEAADRKSVQDEGDLYRLGLALAMDPRARNWGREVGETYRQLRELVKPDEADRALAEEGLSPESPADRERRKRVGLAWLAAFASRLAAKQDKAYQLADGRKGMVTSGGQPGDVILALELHEVGGAGQSRQVSIPLYLPVQPDWVGERGEPEVVCLWDAQRQRVFQERQWKVGGLVVRREPLPPAEWDRPQAEAMLVSKLISGETTLEARNEDVEQLIRRIRLAAEAWPEAGIPALDDEDWELLFHELTAGKAAASEITPEALTEVLRDYVGWEAMARLDREAPRSMPLPSGRKARITYFEGAPPELSARLGDMLGLQGTLRLYDGRVPVLFDILAPNYRTVQKTFDMTGFWQNTYPEVKKELKRRYPKHPWP
ncbi:ATP-dependent RNA helicase HrpB [compost metagenome]